VGFRQWLRNQNIFRKAMLAVSINIVMLAGMGWIGNNALDSIQHQSREVFDKDVSSIQKITEARKNLLLLHLEMHNLLRSEDVAEQPAIRSQVRIFRDGFKNDLQEALTYYYTAEGQQLGQQTQSQWSSLSTFLDELELNAQAQTPQQDVSFQRLRKEGKKHFDEINLLLDALVNRKVKQSHDGFETTQHLISQRKAIFSTFMLLLILTSLLIAWALVSIIVKALSSLGQSAQQVEAGNLEVAMTVNSQDEIGQLSQSFNAMVQALRTHAEMTRQQSWLKDGLNQLSTELAGIDELRPLSMKAISFIGRYLEAGMGAFYIFHPQEEILVLTGSYAFQERNHISNRYQLGEGVVGQVALEQQPITIRHRHRDELVLRTGTVSETPESTMTLPLTYEGKLHGVLEVASFRVLTNLEQEFLKEAVRITSTALYTVRQGEQVRSLLNEVRTKEREISAQVEAINQTNASLFLDIEGVILDANDMMLKMLGYLPRQLLGQPLQILIPKDHYSDTQLHQFWEELRQGMSQSGEFCLTSQNGQDIWLRGAYNPILNGNGEVEKVLMLGADITAAKAQKEQIQELLQEAQNKAQTMQRMNAELEEQQQQMRQQAEELHQSNQVLEEQQQQMRQQAEELQQSNQQMEEQQRLLQQQKETTDLMNSNLRQAQIELDARAKQLEQSNKYKAEFLANMSHELRTPLNSIILLSQLLGRNPGGNLNAKDIEKVQVVHNAGKELLRLINEILDLSKIESGHMSLEVRTFPLTDLLTEQQAYFGPLAEDKGLQFEVENQTQHTHLTTDSSKVSQILRNFLSNAFKFTNAGHVRLTASDSGHRDYPLRLSVQDSGIGIPPEKQALIFEAFRQVDGSTSRVYGGTGLGLSIALELARLLQGRVELQSTPNQGSTFSLLIPWEIKPTEQEDLPPPTHLSAHAPLPMSQPMPAPSDDRMNLRPGDRAILIIEDDPTFARSVAAVNEIQGFKTLIAPSGQEGLHLAATYKPLAIILDIGLPDMSGLDVLDHMKQHPDLRTIPVHIISGQDRASVRPEERGADGFHQKPVSEADLTQLLGQLSQPNSFQTVLFIAESQAQVESLRSQLSNQIKLLHARSIGEALLKLIESPIDGVVLDLDLPGVDPHLMARQLRQERPDLPIILSTHRELSESETQALHPVSDTIVLKSGATEQRLLDEIKLFLNRIGEQPEPQVYLTTAETPEEADFHGKQLLIVDDDVKNTFVLLSALESTGALILTAKNGQEALDMLAAHPNVDLVLMDIMMPVMNGYEAMEAIRANPATAHIPIIAATAKALKDDRAKCFEAGANDYIAKPIDLQVLLALIQRWLNP
jgi:PAS domain S-box-containing protein